MPKDKKKKEEETLSVSSLTLGYIASTSEQQPLDVVGLGLTGSRRKKKKRPLKDKPVSTEVTEAVEEEVSEGVKEQVETKQQSEVVNPQEAAESKEDTQKRKETKDDEDDTDSVGLGLGRGKKNRKKKKTEISVPFSSLFLTIPETDKPEALPLPNEQLQDVPQSTQPSTSKSTTAWSGGAWCKPPQLSQSGALYPELKPTLQPMVHVAPQPSSSRLQMPEYGTESGLAGETQVPRNVFPKAQRKAKSALSPTCLYNIPDKVFGNSVPCRQIKVLTNYLQMTIQPIKLYRYDVSCKPDRPVKFIVPAYELAVKKHFSKIPLAFDQRKNFYSLTLLPGVPLNDRFTCNVAVNDRDQKQFVVEVTLKCTGSVELETILTHIKSRGTSLNPPTEAIQAVDIILRQGLLHSYIKAGHELFKRPANPLDLGEGLEMWTGLFQSAIFTSRAFVNIDVAHKGFPRYQLLIDAYVRDFKLDPSKTVAEQRGPGVSAFEHYIKGLRVIAYVGGDVQTGQQRDFICNGLVESSRKMFFKLHQGTPQEENCSVYTYFEKEKNMRIRYPDLNCVWVGSNYQRVYYPMEFLHVSRGQVNYKPLNERQFATLIRESTTPPNDRKKKIEDVLKDVNYSNSAFFKKFGLGISEQFTSVDAKVLPAPKIQVGGGTVNPCRGAWRYGRLLHPKPLESWGLIALDNDPRSSFESLVNHIIRVGNDIGMKVKNPKAVLLNIKIVNLARTLQTFKDKGIAFVFIVIPVHGKDYYDKLKCIAEREVGVITQCVKEITVTKKINEQIVRHLMLKVNIKLMGINHAIDKSSLPLCLRQGKVMIVGADVTHPSPDQRSIPSIAALTASIDNTFVKYHVTISVQQSKKEVIIDFENMMVEHLNEFEKNQKELPSKIFVFRDGVSDGQFAQIMNHELHAVYNAYKRKIGPGSTKRPQVLFILVQKRHHTRFFNGDSKYNAESGTVVDSEIVHPKELDFYLVSHHPTKGTARPIRYRSLCNDGGIAQDEVELLTYYLCHTYSRCASSVSYPTPTYYAHLACMHARSLTSGDRFCLEDLEKSPQRIPILAKIFETSGMFYI